MSLMAFKNLYTIEKVDVTFYLFILVELLFT